MLNSIPIQYSLSKAHSECVYKRVWPQTSYSMKWIKDNEIWITAENKYKNNYEKRVKYIRTHTQTRSVHCTHTKDVLQKKKTKQKETQNEAKNKKEIHETRNSYSLKHIATHKVIGCVCRFDSVAFVERPRSRDIPEQLDIIAFCPLLSWYHSKH